jgi:hypothetical protein
MDSNASLVMIGCPSGRSFNEKSSRYELSMVEKKERKKESQRRKKRKKFVFDLELQVLLMLNNTYNIFSKTN